MTLIKKLCLVALLILLGLCLLQFMAVNPQPVVLKSVLGTLPALTLAQAVLGSWLLGMMMGLMSMSLRYRWQRLTAKSARMTQTNAQ
jgi:uncharacterized integral membrane protein